MNAPSLRAAITKSHYSAPPKRMQASRAVLRLTGAADRSNFRPSSLSLPRTKSMHTANSSSASAPSIPVPMLDVTRENKRLETELEAAMTDVSRSGAFVHGPAVTKFEAAMAEYCGVMHAVGCASGSDAILLSLMALGIGPGDEVIVPSFTFFATASAVWRLGAKPVFAEIIPETFNLDPADVVYKI